MEIVDYLRLARRRLWLLVLVPVLAAAAAAAVVLLRPPEFTATATVDPPALLGTPGTRYSGAQGVNQYVAAFQAAAQGPAVLDRVAEVTGAAADSLPAGLDVAQQGSGPTLLVTFSSSEEDVVRPVVETVTREAVGAVFGARVEAEQARVEVARAEVDAATGLVTEFTAANGLADPQSAYEAQLSQVNALVQQQVGLRAGGETDAADALTPAVEESRAALERYVPLLAEYGDLSAERDAAAGRLSDAQGALDTSTAQLAAADPDQTAYISGPQRVDEVGELVRTVLPVAGAGLLVAVVLVAGLEVAARGRAARREQPRHAGVPEA